MPAGVADSPRGIPFKLLVVKLGLGEPENKVCLVSLICVLLNALANAYLKIFLLEVIEHVIFIQLGCIKIAVSASLVCIALFE